MSLLLSLSLLLSSLSSYRCYCLCCYVVAVVFMLLSSLLCHCLCCHIIAMSSVETDRPSGPYWLHGPSRSRASYMLQIILQTNWTVMDCRKLLYTLSLYGHMLIIAIIVLILLMSIVLNFYFSLL